MQDDSLMETWSKQWTEVDCSGLHQPSDSDARFELLQMGPKFAIAIKRLNQYRKLAKIAEQKLSKLTERKLHLESQLVEVQHISPKRSDRKQKVNWSALDDIVKAAKAGKLMEYIQGGV